jgi:isopenicillin N synthase-like dioxygenase
LDRLSSPDPTAKHALAANIRNASVNVGFFYCGFFISIFSILQLTSDLVKNHGIPEDIIQDTIVAAQQFFSLPESEKIKVYLSAFLIPVIS